MSPEPKGQIDRDQAYALVLGAMIAALREARGLKQRNLAEIAQVNASTLSRIERGESIPDAGTLRRLGEALGLSLPMLTEKVEEAVVQAEKTARRVVGRSVDEPWWETVVAAAGKAALMGVIALAVGFAGAATSASRKK